jgi:2-dehydro-3-deoxy-D-pentonate aldolase
MPKNNNPPKTHHGVIVPLVTPINGDGKLDEAALRRLVDHVIAGGAEGIFVLGTTGEGPSVPRGMRARVVQVAIDQAAKRVRVYAGVADTSLSDTMAAAAEYRKLGVDVSVATLPYYYALNPDEQFHYFTRLVDCVAGPVLLYDIPAVTNIQLDLSVIEHLRAFSNVAGIKDSTGDPERLEKLLDLYAGDPNFCILVGVPKLASLGLRNGADGVVLSTANLDPGLCARLYASAETGDTALMDELQAAIDALTAEFQEGHTLGQGIVHLKRMLSQRGLCGPKVFPPLKEVE